MRRFLAILVLGTAVFTSACREDRPTPTSPTVGDAVANISDGRNPGGNPDFFFEPPIQPDPESDPNFDEGRFNPFLSPMIRICALDEDIGECAEPQPSGLPIEFTMMSPPPSRIRLVMEDEHYVANWVTRDYDLNPAVDYRVQVFARRDLDEAQPPPLLGFADVDVLGPDDRAREVSRQELVPLRNGQALPIKFRAELGLLCYELNGSMGGLNCNDATAVALDDNGGDVVVPSRHGAGRFNEGWIPQAALDAGITEVTVIIAAIDIDPGAGGDGLRCFPTAALAERQSCYLYTTDPELDAFGRDPADNLPDNQFIVFDRGEVISAMCIDPAISQADWDEYQLFQYDPDKEPFVQNGILVLEPSDQADALLDCSNFVALSDNPILRFAQERLRSLWHPLAGALGPAPLWARHGTSGQGALAGSFSPSNIGWARALEQSIASGGGQTGVIGSQLAAPIVARMIEFHIDPGGESEQPHPIANEPVTFTVTEGGVSLDGTTGPQTTITVSTDEHGEASVFWTLGPTVGDQTMLVNSVAYNSPNTVTATAIELEPAELYSVNSADDGLSRIDPVTGQATFIGPLDPDPVNLTTPVSMAVRPSDQTIFVWDNTERVLVTVDRSNGLATRVGPESPANDAIGALAFSPAGDLFATGVSDLYEIDPATGNQTVVGSLGLRVAGADFSPNGVLFGLELVAEDARLVTIDPTAASVSVIGTLDPDPGLIGSIVFAPDGSLIGSSLDGELFDIDPATAVTSNFRAVTSDPDQGLVVGPPQGMGFVRSGPGIEGPPPGITFGSQRDGNYDVYMTGATELQRLTSNPAPEFPADWSADGSTLVFQRGGVNCAVLWTLDPASGVETPLTLSICESNDPDAEGATRGRWSPDGQHVAYISNRGLVRAVNTDGSGRTSLASTYFQYPDEPDWSADGTRLLHLALVPVDGMFQAQIAIAASSGAGDVFVRQAAAPSACGQYSPDGSQIAFVAEFIPSSECAGAAIKLMDASGTNESFLLSGSDLRGVRWSPAGGRLAVVIAEEASENLYVIDSSGSELDQLTAGFTSIDTDPDSHPAWSPDGDWIAFVGIAAGSADREVYAVRVADHSLLNVSQNPGGNDLAVTWRN